MTTKCRILSLAAVAALFPVAAMTVSAADGDAPTPAPAKSADAPAPEKKADAPAVKLPADQQAVVDAEKAFSDAQKAANEAMAPFSKTARDLATEKKAATTDEEKKAIDEKAKANNEASAKVRAEHNKKQETAHKAVATAFKKSDWQKWDPATQASAMDGGLNAIVRTAEDNEQADVVKAIEFAMKVLPKSKATVSMVGGSYAEALTELGDLAVAVKKLTAALPIVGETGAPGMKLDIGDIQCFQGKIDEAKATFAEGLKMIPAELEPRDPRTRAKGGLQQRVDLIGKTAPEINSTTWIGGEAKPLSALKGKVVVMDFFATWCPPCRMALPGLSEVAKDFAGKPVQVISIVKQENTGAIPHDKAGVPSGPYTPWTLSDAAKADKEKANTEYMAHINAFYKVADLGYPFVVSNREEQKPYGISGIPCLFVLDKEGRIVYIENGFHGNNHGLKRAANMALSLKPSAPAADAPKADATKGGEPKADTASTAAPAKS